MDDPDKVETQVAAILGFTSSSTVGIFLIKFRVSNQDVALSLKCTAVSGMKPRLSGQKGTGI